MSTSLDERSSRMLPRGSLHGAGGQRPGRARPSGRRSPVFRASTGPQRASALLMAAASLVGVGWYVPRVIAADATELTGTVTSNGVIDLNFAGTGQVARILVAPGQQVRKGQLLATEVAPAALAVVAADNAAIAADLARLAADRSAGADAAQLAAARAQRAKDAAQLATDRSALARTRIVAPASGSVLALNAQPGEIVSPAGVRAYPYQSPQVPVSQQPLFSLLPEGPQASYKVTGPATDAALPVIELRASASWQVIVLVGEQSVRRIRLGVRARVGVPAAGIHGLPGRISELLTTPVSTAQGFAYQAIVAVAGGRGAPPLDGMTADVRLGG